MQLIQRTGLTAALLLLIAVRLAGAELPCDSMAVRLNRLYFPVGTEHQVYRYSRFSVVKGPDTLAYGQIEHSWQGISVSAELDSLTVQRLSDSNLTAFIETAEVDSNVTVTLGTDNAYLASIASGDTLRVRIIRYDVRETMLQDFARGNLDGLLSFRALERQCGDVSGESAPAPCLAVLIPNVGKRINAGGILTTSLYYRYRDARQFEGDQPRDAVRLNPFDQTTFDLPAARPYPFGSPEGRALFANLNDRPPKLRLYAGDASLNRLALYFADLMSRDRCPVEISATRAGVDLYLEFVPRSNAVPSATLYELYHRMVRDSIPGLAGSEHLRRIAALFAFVERPMVPVDYYRNLSSAERVMTEDLGVFALFQPTVFLTVRLEIQGLTLDADGRLAFETLRRVRLPKSLGSTQP